MSVDSPPGWVRDAVFYQIFPDRFARAGRVPEPGPFEPWGSPPTAHGMKGGDLHGIVERLDQISDLGVTALYLNPVFASASNHRFHTYDYYTVDPVLGGNMALRELLDEAHRRGMRVILDGVFNHSGRGFWPFHHVLELGSHSPYRDWFHLHPAVLNGQRRARAYPDGSGSVKSALVSLGYAAWWNLPALPKLNIANPQMREYLLGVAEHWIRFGADGWRLDVATEIGDMAFWAEFRSRVRAANPEAYLLAEIWNVAPQWVGAGRFDATMNYPLAFAMLGFAAGAHLDLGAAAGHTAVRAGLHPLDGPAFAARVEELLRAYPSEHAAAELNLLGSHDTPRALTLCGGDEASLRIAMLLQMAMPGAPCIYYGDEIGMAGLADPDCRRAFPSDEAEWNAPLRSFVRSAIAARSADRALRGDGFRCLAASGSLVAFERSAGHARAIVAVNAGEEEVSLTLPVTIDPAALVETLTSDGRAARLRPGSPSGLALALPARWAGIWRVPRDAVDEG